MGGRVRALVANVAHEVLGAHFLGQGAHEVAGRSDPLALVECAVEAGLFGGTGPAGVAAAVIPVKYARRENVAQLVVPGGRAVDVLEVDTLACLVLVVIWAVKERLGKPPRVVEVMRDCKGDG
jgi:hypothetical protein